MVESKAGHQAAIEIIILAYAIIFLEYRKYYCYCLSMDKTKVIIELPKKEPDRWASIKMHLAIRGYTFCKLASEHSLSTCTLTIVKNKSYPKSQKIIADALVLKPEWIWPERYGDDGKPIANSPRYPRQKNTTSTCRRQRKSQKRVKQ